MSEPSYTMEQAAAMLNLGRNTLYAILREQQVLNVENFPNSAYRGKGYFIVRQVPYQVGCSGITRIQAKLTVTNKGMKLFGKAINQHEQNQDAEKKAKRRADAEEISQRKEAEQHAWQLVLNKPWTTNNEPNTCPI